MHIFYVGLFVSLQWWQFLGCIGACSIQKNIQNGELKNMKGNKYIFVCNKGYEVAVSSPIVKCYRGYFSDSILECPTLKCEKKVITEIESTSQDKSDTFETTTELYYTSTPRSDDMKCPLHDDTISKMMWSTEEIIKLMSLEAGIFLILIILITLIFNKALVCGRHNKRNQELSSQNSARNMGIEEAQYEEPPNQGHGLACEEPVYTEATGIYEELPEPLSNPRENFEEFSVKNDFYMMSTKRSR